MEKVVNNGVEINYNIYGDGTPTLLFAHGSFIDQTYWKDQVAHFKNHYKVVTLDLGGHGQSGQNRDSWTIEDFGEDVLSLIKVLDFHEVIMIGHSLGADAVLEAIIAQPQNIIGFIAVDYFKNVGTAFPEDQANQILESLRTNFSDTSESYARTGLLTKNTPADITKKVVNAYRTANRFMGLKSIEALFNYSKKEVKLLKKLQLKLHLINVDYMPTNDAALQNLGVNYDVHPIQGTSHFPMIENPGQFNIALENAISEILDSVPV